MATHNFNTDLAERYGIEEAIILHNMEHWIAKNIANKKHAYDGNYWTYNSTKAFTELFPYMNQSKIVRVLKHLTDEGVLNTGNYNKLKFDRTSWYSFSEAGYQVMQKAGYKIKNPFFILTNGDNQNEKTIPYSKLHIINTDKKDISNDISKKENSSFVESDSTSSDSNVKDSFTPLIPPDGSDDKPKRGRKAKPQSFDARADLSYVEDKFTKLWLFWLDYKDEIKKPYKTLVGAKSSFTRLRNGSNNNVTLAHAMVMTAIEKSYDGFFALSEKQESFFLSSKSPYCNDVKEFLTEDDNADSAPQPQSSVDSKWQG